MTARFNSLQRRLFFSFWLCLCEILGKHFALQAAFKHAPMFCIRVCVCVCARLRNQSERLCATITKWGSLSQGCLLLLICFSHIVLGGEAGSPFFTLPHLFLHLLQAPPFQRSAEEPFAVNNPGNLQGAWRS